jgi:hypothetical protein
MIMQRFARFSILPAAMGLLSTSAISAPLVVSITESGTALNANPAIATSESNRLPQPEGAGTSGALGDETYAYVTRTHEWTAVRTNNTTGLLSNVVDDTMTTLHAFPSYLNRLEYVQIANENRTVEDYQMNLTFSSPVRAYLFVDNRVNGDADNNSSSNTTDPVLTNEVAWIVNDGWQRVNTGFMPNGQPDYIGVDEGATVASPDLRTHPTTVGSGVGLNQFSAIFRKDFSAGAQTGVVKKLGITNTNMYGLAIAAIPEPSSVVLSLLGLGWAAIGIRRR